MKTKAFNFISPVLILLIASVLSCSSVEPNDDRTLDMAEYGLDIQSSHPGGKKMLVGKNVDSTWDPEDGGIWLGTDDNREPLGTLTMVNPAQVGDDRYEYDVLLSTSDKRVGNGAEINARVYEGYGVEIKASIGTNFIEAKNIDWTLERVLVNLDDVPETIAVTGYFIAVSK